VTPVEITMPQLGESVTEGTILRWFKSVGEPIEANEVLFEVATDKVDAEVPSPVAGVLTDIRIAEGATVPVGAVLAVVAGADTGSALRRTGPGDRTRTGPRLPPRPPHPARGGGRAQRRHRHRPPRPNHPA
jgi:pyruvate dehydrogenase E2 component (dihydrolipoamide acetyltransferase)